MLTKASQVARIVTQAPKSASTSKVAIPSRSIVTIPKLVGIPPGDHLHNLNYTDEKILAEYIWLGGAGDDIRCKTKVVGKDKKTNPEALPVWNYDGSSTGQASGHDSECLIKPQAVFPDPFRGSPHILVLCDTYDGKGQPLKSNKRILAKAIFDKYPNVRPRFAFEQEYSLFHMETHLGWPPGGYPAPQGPYYCSVGYRNNFGREIAELHLKAALYAKLGCSGINAEVLAGQWEYQIGPVEGIAAADEMIISRYLLQRITEKYQLEVSFDPKPIAGDWNGAGCHVNFCFKSFHEPDGKGWQAIEGALKKLEKRHAAHIEVYGRGNERRLTGHHETAPINVFSWGVANRGASIRIPRHTFQEQRGYIEDRRPASNIDPYEVSSIITETCLGNY